MFQNHMYLILILIMFIDTLSVKVFMAIFCIMEITFFVNEVSLILPYHDDAIKMKHFPRC